MKYNLRLSTTRQRVIFHYLLFFIIFSPFAFSQPKQISLEDIFRNNLFSAKSVYGIRSMKDGGHYTVLEDNRYILKCEYRTGETVDTLFRLREKNAYEIEYIYDYELSDDERKILFSTNIQPLYRHSFSADHYVWDMNRNDLVPVSGNGSQRLATFSPDGAKIAFVRDNNLYIRSADGEEYAVTTDGAYNEIIHGAPDWVYEEEFGFDKAFAWSPDSRRIAWMRFDESRVPLYIMPEYGNLLYPYWYTFKYPKAGEKNSVVSVHVYDLETKHTSPVDIGNDAEQYIPRLKWTCHADRLCVIRLNRLQNKVDILINDVAANRTKLLYSETNPCYIDEIDDDYIHFTPDGKYFYMFSERSGYNHLYLHDLNSGKQMNAITSGDYDVTGLLGYHSGTKRIYYTAADESPLRRNIFSVGINGKKPEKMNTEAGTHEAVFSRDFRYYINYYSNGNTPPEIRLYDTRGNNIIRTLEDNAELKGRIRKYGFVQKEFLSIPTSSGIHLNAYILKPDVLEPGKEYPLFMYVYGGPGSQQVSDSWDRSMAWKQMLVRKGYIVACVDNRGTGYRGEEFRKCTYMQLGKYETEDQIAAAVFLGDLPYIDQSRIGIFGWSYGGYMSSLCLTLGAGVFKAGIAVAPVTNWRFYDTIYTERYMRTPQENPSGYDDNSPINHVEKLKGKFLLVHGSADDNVHYQNTLVFAEKLVQANKPFEMQIYPDKNHGISGGNTSLHLYTRITDFIINNL